MGSVSGNVSIESDNKVEIGASAVLAGYEDWLDARKNRICFPDKSCYNTSRVLKKRKEYWRNHYG